MDMLCSDAREMTVQLRLLFSVTWFGTCLGHEGTCNKRNKIKTTLIFIFFAFRHQILKFIVPTWLRQRSNLWSTNRNSRTKVDGKK